MRSVLALMLGCALVTVCYLYVDRPVAWFVHNHRFSPESFQPWPPLLSDWLETTAGMAIVGVVVWWIWSPGSKLQRLLVVIAANLVVTVGIKSLLKGTFGRTWPESWLGENPSLIANGVYGFHLFHFGRAYASFPSGHAAATFAVVSILWLSRPRFRWLYALVAAGMCLALVGLNYHFVSDVLAGAMLGSLTGVCATGIFRLTPP